MNMKRLSNFLEKYIDPASIIWISIGSFRYMPDLKWHILKRFPGTNIFDGEFVTGLDGKQRYFKPIRVEMYAKLSERLIKWHDKFGNLISVWKVMMCGNNRWDGLQKILLLFLATSTTE